MPLPALPVPRCRLPGPAGYQRHPGQSSLRVVVASLAQGRCQRIWARLRVFEAFLARRILLNPDLTVRLFHGLLHRVKFCLGKAVTFISLLSPLVCELALTRIWKLLLDVWLSLNDRSAALIRHIGSGDRFFARTILSAYTPFLRLCCLLFRALTFLNNR